MYHLLLARSKIEKWFLLQKPHMTVTVSGLHKYWTKPVTFLISVVELSAENVHLPSL